MATPRTMPWPTDTADPLTITVRCAACSRVSEHRITQATLAPPRARVRAGAPADWDGFYTPSILTCPGCDTPDEYALTAESMGDVAARARAGGEASGPVMLAVPRLWDGTFPRRPTQALAHLRALAEAKPSSGEAWRRLGNACERCGVMEEAVSERFARCQVVEMTLVP